VANSYNHLNTSNLEIRLNSSVAIKSLLSEQSVVELLRSLGWRVTHGLYFLDPITTKPRELDVSAYRKWYYEKRVQEFFLYIKCEVKTAKDYHLIFSPMVDSDLGDTAYLNWFGHEQQSLYKRITELNLPPQTIENLRLRISTYIHPPASSVRTHKLFIPPFPGQFRSTAFRETNIGSEKDLENSVLWRTLQGLDSALESSRRDLIKESFAKIFGTARFPDFIQMNDPEQLLDAIEMELDAVHIFHPVIIIESKLWFLDKKKLRPIPWCRFCRVAELGRHEWCDIVNSNSAKKYFAALTRYYNSKMKRLHAVLAFEE
jgi:hypothetical protein